MNRGRKTADPSAKAMAGTYRKDRHANIAPIAAPVADDLIQPAYLSPEAKLVWAEEVKRVTAIGATSVDSSMFARYCEAEAYFRCVIKAGEEFPTASLMAELRRMSEMLGIAGARSRLARIATPEAPKASPFAVRPK